MSNKQTFELDRDSELRFEVEDKNGTVKLVLEQGMAEVFGSELVPRKEYVFTYGAKIAVFTWHGCVVHLYGKPDVAYIAKDTPMSIYLNTHAGLEQLRIEAEKKDRRGPVVLIVGQVDTGKSTVAKILINYAVRVGRRPVFVDLDVGQGHLAVPGMMTAVLVERPVTPEDGFSEKAPLVYSFGHKSPSDNMAMYNILVTRLGQAVRERLRLNKKANHSGVIINTCGWVKAAGYRSITHVAMAFEVDLIIVLDNEKLYNELAKDVPEFVWVVFQPKSAGVVDRTQTTRAENRERRIRSYFYGPKKELYPHTFEVKFSEMKVYKIGAPSLPDSCMPLGMKCEDSQTRIVPVQPGPSLLHRILALSSASSIDDDLIRQNVHGFITVTDVSLERECLTVLSPQPRPLPPNPLILTEIEFMDSV
ncbi:unnamed protein product [Cyprideis torosa]|uniref:Protein CLP1 homolog n=1 Tax=Cyprideis torosa TaxID=163714 RepID=A0A7R8WET9_9CRUS|nr:unnamed protein product [Cyprideis torosa]CAG0890727.1 unnamed protein product [Cyprideis torosa]